MPSVVFIGGPWDGRLVAIRDDAPNYFVVTTHTPSYAAGSLYPHSFNLEKAVYRPMQWHAEKRRFEIWALEGMTSADMMERLIFKATIANPQCPTCDVAMLENGSRWECRQCGANQVTPSGGERRKGESVPKPKISCLASWYGSNRMLGEHVGKLLNECSWVGVPFAGGMAELAHIKARTMLVSDLHRHVINLAMVAADPDMNQVLRDRLDGLLVHPDCLEQSQERCRLREDGKALAPCWTMAHGESLQWAIDYFACVWMARNATAGTDSEFTAGPSIRWNAGGGDSAVRFRNATESLKDWQPILRRCTFVTDDVFDFLDKVHDEPGHGVYCDPPFPGPGDKYRHKFNEAKQRKLAARLSKFSKCRIVCRFYDVPLIRDLYPEPAWKWQCLTGRKQSNGAAAEVLLVRN